MTVTNKEEQQQQQLGKIWELYTSFRDSGDDRGAKRLFKLLEKNYRNWQAACLCGHFSAGKSTLLNTLLSDDLLPTSPIPTSGNLVRLEPGPEQVRVMYKNGETATLLPPYDASKLKEFAKNTEEIDELRIQMGDDFPPNWMLFDTPGVDATDREHQAATEDAVFLADSIIYVSDYNHLQSEANFNFLDSVQRLGKPIYLVVNQIDKHQDQEIPFETYQAQIEQSFKDWGLHIERIFYLSLADLDHPYNEWEYFKDFINTLSTRGPVTNDVDPLLDALISDHKDWWKQTHEIENPSESGSSEALLDQEKELKEEHQELESKLQITNISDWLDQAKQTINRTIESAVLTPYDTRELARLYLESIQPDFKVGFFSTKGKVHKEQHERLHALLEDLNEKVATLNWQTADTFFKVTEELFEQKDVLKQISQQLQLQIDEKFIRSQTNKGARITGAYLLTFADQLAKALQKEMRLLVNEKLEEIEPELSVAFEQQQTELKNRLEENQQALSDIQQAASVKKEEMHHFDTLEAILDNQVEPEAQMLQSIEHVLESPPIFNLLKNDSQMKKPSESKEAKRTIDQKAIENNQASDSSEVRLNADLQPLETETLINASKALKAAKGFEETAATLISKLDRLENKRLTVALFGAFSAGKSSFANALLGESVLKVSPNPTTAVVNRILPVDDEHPHGHMVLFMKSEEALLQDLHRALKPFGQTLDSLDDLEKTIQKLPDLGAGYSKGKLYLAFLKAVSVGLKDARTDLGTPVVVDMETGQDSVANETKACLIDRVDLYYDCEATRKGMILVDTPGADSLNARHTETSYKYIKSADAIVFVTYYQHAFSRADETFLRQLGRIQDAFDRDKFFFIVNAIDLARNDFEREQVVQFVTGQLRQLGLDSPRLFGLSSLEALRAKQSNDNERWNQSGFQHFIEDWDHFVHHDLIDQSLRSVFTDIERSANLLDDFIEKGQMTDAEREEVLDHLTEDAKEKEGFIKTSSSEWMVEELDKTIEELYYYAKQRLSLQLTENFSKFFNPAVLRQDRGSKRAVLAACLEECISYLSNELEQEVRSTGIRVEATLSKMMHAYQAQVNQGLGKQWTIPDQDIKEWTSSPLPFDFIDIPREPLEKPFRLYKNQKQFFEENGIKQFKEELLNELDPAAHSFLDDASRQAKETYQQQLSDAIELYQSQAVNALHALYEQKDHSIRESRDLQASYQEVRSQLNSLGI